MSYLWRDLEHVRRLGLKPKVTYVLGRNATGFWLGGNEFAAVFHCKDVHAVPLRHRVTDRYEWKAPSYATMFVTEYNPNSNAADGRVQYSNGWVWSAVHDAAVGTGVDQTDGNVSIGSSHSSTAGVGYMIRRGFFHFDTTTLNAGASISSVVFSGYVNSKANGDNDGDDWVVPVQSTAANPASLVIADYNKCGAITNPTEGASRVDITSITTSAWLDFTLNATGRSWVVKEGISKFGVREGHDALNSPVANDTVSRFSIISSEGANDPKLTVTYELVLLPLGKASASVTGKQLLSQITMPLVKASVALTGKSINLLYEDRVLSAGFARVIPQTMPMEIRMPVTPAAITISTGPLQLIHMPNVVCDHPIAVEDKDACCNE